MNLPFDEIICGDSIEIMGDFPDECVDMIFADPPFNIGKNYTHGDKRTDYKKWCRTWIDECWRILKPTGSLYLMTIPKYLEWLLPLVASGGVFINLIKWRNVSACHTKRYFWGEYQPIILYGKTKDYIFNTYAETIESGQRRWGGYSAGSGYKGQMKDCWDDIKFVFTGSVIHPEAVLEPGTKKKLHPCQMPIKLATRAIRFSTGPRAVVLDPFSGTGTSCVAAKMLERRFIGIDISAVYCKVARQRLEQTETGVPVREQNAGQKPLFPPDLEPDPETN